MTRKVVITGVGLISAIGKNLPDFWASVKTGTSGIGFVEGVRENGKPVRLGGEVKNFEARQYVSPKQKKLSKVMSRDIQLAVVAAKFAMEDAQFSEGSVSFVPERFGISVGSSLINNDLDEFAVAFKAASENGKLVESRVGFDVAQGLTPLWMLKYLPNMPSCHITISYDLRGPSNTITTEGASGLQAIGEAFRIIERGSADLMIAGGVDSKVNGIALSRYDLLGLLPKKSDGKILKYIPFSSEGDYLIPGEAAAFFILEEKAHAQKRSARIYGEIKGFGSSPIYDYHIRDSKDVDGRFISIKKAMQDAGFTPQDLDFLVANGIGIHAADRCESEAIGRFFGPTNKIPVTCLKPLTGYVGSANGTLETVMALKAMETKMVPPVAGLSTSNSTLNFLKKELTLKTNSACRSLVNAYGITGEAASLVLERSAS